MPEFSILLADPPWEFNRSGDTRRTADSQYPCMSTAELCAMDSVLIDTLSPRAALFMWATAATLPDALRVMSAWGFEYKTVAFVWVKCTSKALNDRELKTAVAAGEQLVRYGDGHHRMHFGMGHYTRAQTEFVLIGKRGDMTVDDRAVRQVIHAPVREHSRKPDETYQLIERLYPSRAYLELFARARRPGWAAFGNETGKFGVVT